jgi:tRNA A-37 threonylcarbamoyl transferase component Bud32
MNNPRPERDSLPGDAGSRPFDAPTLAPAQTADSSPEPPATTATLDDSALGNVAGSPRGVPGYEVLDELGRGGMGVVYKARQVRANRVVALKMILAGEHASAEARSRFKAEAEAVARMQHPHIVQLFEVGEHDGLPYFSLEFCPGGSLDQRLRGNPLPPRQAAELVEHLAGAVDAAHRNAIVHRDLKPANVLLAEDGTPKVSDFGLAKRLGEAGQTTSGALLGTPSYMAPEQAAGKRGAIGPAADVYALGSILYECLTGRPPFKAATPTDTLLQVLADEPMPPRRLNPQVPVDIQTICLKCLEKNPGRRYSDACALAEDLRRFGQGEPILAVPAGPLTRAVKWARRRPTVALLTALVVIVAITGVVSFAREYGIAVYRLAELNGANAALAATNTRLEVANATLAKANAALTVEKNRGFTTALNKALSLGVTPDNNANVLLWRAIGPHPEGITLPREFFARLGMETPPDQGDYFVRYEDYLKKDPPVEADGVARELSRTAARPWAAADFPPVAAWLKANEKPLAVVNEATRRARYYVPLDPGDARPLVAAPLHSAQRCRILATCLLTRAMLHMGTGEYRDAREDLLTCHRLAHLVGEGSVIEAPVAVAIDVCVSAADVMYLDRARPDAETIRQYRDDLNGVRAVPGLAEIADRISFGGRFLLLEVITSNDKMTNGAIQIDLDSNAAVGCVNGWSDRIAAALRNKDRESRMQELKQIHADWSGIRLSHMSGASSIGPGWGDATARGKWWAETLLVAAELDSIVLNLHEAVESSEQIRANLSVALSLALYQREHGRYPECLAALEPKYVGTLPQDTFSGKPLIYRPTENGYILYSVGKNGRDDGGRSWSDNPPGDDLVIRMPVPEVPGK